MGQSGMEQQAAALFSDGRAPGDVAECYRDKSSAGASTSRSAGPRDAAETLSNPKPYRARQIAVDAARAVRQSIVESPTSTVADGRTPAARDKCSSPDGSGFRGNVPSPATTAGPKNLARSNPSRIAVVAANGLLVKRASSARCARSASTSGMRGYGRV